MSGLRLDRPVPGVAVLRLDRPERLNALDDDLLLEALPDAVAELGADDGVRAVVVTGEGRGFCAGADLDCSGFSQPAVDDAEVFMRRSHQTPIGLRLLGKPSIAAVNGAAVGAGFGLALACDFRFAAPEARLGAPFVRMGLVPDFGVSWFLPRLVGTDRALDLLLTGRLIDVDEAMRLGVVTRRCDDVVADAVAYAAQLAALPPRAVAATRANVYRSAEVPVPEGLLDYEARTQAIALFSEEFAREFAAWRAAVTGGPER